MTFRFNVSGSLKLLCEVTIGLDVTGVKVLGWRDKNFSSCGIFLIVLRFLSL